MRWSSSAWMHSVMISNDSEERIVPPLRSENGRTGHENGRHWYEIYSARQNGKNGNTYSDYLGCTHVVGVRDGFWI